MESPASLVELNADIGDIVFRPLDHDLPTLSERSRQCDVYPH